MFLEMSIEKKYIKNVGENCVGTLQDYKDCILKIEMDNRYK